MSVIHYRKEAAVDADPVGEDLILMHLGTRRIIILNGTGSILWDALDTFSTADELAGLLGEALPGQPAAGIETSLRAMLESLQEGGFLHAEEEAALSAAA